MECLQLWIHCPAWCPIWTDVLGRFSGFYCPWEVIFWFSKINTEPFLKNNIWLSILTRLHSTYTTLTCFFSLSTQNYSALAGLMDAFSRSPRTQTFTLVPSFAKKFRREITKWEHWKNASFCCKKKSTNKGHCKYKPFWDIFGPQNGGLPFFLKASEMMSGVGGVYASVKTKHCNTAREGHFGESAPTKPQIGGWVGAVHRIWVTFGVPVRGTSQICLRGLRHEDCQYECKHTTYRD